MLHPRELELLTALVDGELNARHRRRAARLLRRSGKARAVFRRLRQDSQRLQQLMPVPAPADLAATILDTIAARNLQPAPRVQPAPTPGSAPAPTTLPVWVNWVLAASVLLAIGLGSFFLHANRPSRLADEGIARQQRDELPLNRHTEQELALLPPRVQPPEKPFVGPLPDDSDPESLPEESRPARQPALPVEFEDPPPPRILASGQQEMPGKFEQIDLALPIFQNLAELDSRENLVSFQATLQRGSAWRIEFPARDATRGMERLRLGLSARKVHLMFDPIALGRLRKPLWKTDYALFLENLSAADLAEIIRVTGQADRQGEQRLEGTVVAKEMTGLDRKELQELLGVDPLANRPTVPLPPKIDIRKPLPDQTGAQVNAALEGKGPPRPAASADLHGYLTVLNSLRSRPVELKKFIDSRQTPRPGTLQVLIVVRNVGA